MMARTFVIATFDIPGWHAWPTPPDEVRYLRSPHRHLFHFRVEVETTNPDREIEFHMMARIASDRCHALWADDERPASPQPDGLRLGARSCEHMARELGDSMRLLDAVPVCAVEVWEDRENGARVEWDAPSGAATKVD
jgi:hypothetical protein